MIKESSSSSEVYTKFPPIFWAIIILSIITLAIVICVYAYNFNENFELSEKQDVWGMFGDYFGGILGPAFAFYGLMALLYSIFLQNKELHDTKVQLKKSYEGIEKQNGFIQKQNFEATYFHLLELYNQIIQGFSLETKDANEKINKLNKRECFRSLLFLFQNIRIDHIRTSGSENLNVAYNLFKNKYEYLIGHYLRTISNILNYIDKSELSEQEKNFYANILRGQLSLYELGLIHYDTLYGNETNLSIIQKYKIVPESSADFLNAISVMSPGLK